MQTVAVHNIEDVAELRAVCGEIERATSESRAIRGIERDAVRRINRQRAGELRGEIFIKHAALQRATVQSQLPDQRIRQKVLGLIGADPGKIENVACTETRRRKRARILQVKSAASRGIPVRLHNESLSRRNQGHTENQRSGSRRRIRKLNLASAIRVDRIRGASIESQSFISSANVDVLNPSLNIAAAIRDKNTDARNNITCGIVSHHRECVLTIEIGLGKSANRGRERRRSTSAAARRLKDGHQQRDRQQAALHRAPACCLAAACEICLLRMPAGTYGMPVVLRTAIRLLPTCTNRARNTFDSPIARVIPTTRTLLPSASVKLFCFNNRASPRCTSTCPEV